MTTQVYNLLKGQREFLEVPNGDVVTEDYSIYQGGFGAGKTWVGCLLGILLCRANPGLLMLSVAKTYAQLEDTTMRMYQQHLDDMGYIPGRDYVFKKTSGKSRIKFYCHGNSEIIFKQAEKDAIRSITAGAIQVEEISQLTREDFTELTGRLRQPGIKRRRLFGHTNPQASRGWIHELFVEKNKGLIEATDAAGQKGVIQYRRIISATTDNPYLPPGYVASLKHQFDEEYYKIFVLGQDGDYMSGLLVKGWTFANEEAVAYDPLKILYLSCDFNVDPMCWVVAHRVGDEFHFFDEIYIENTNIEEACDEFIQRYGDHKSGIIITGDAAGNQRRAEGSHKTGLTSYKQMVSYLSYGGVRKVTMDVPSANPHVADRFAAWNAAVCSREGTRKIRINVEKCPKLMYNIFNLRYQPGTSILMKPSLKQMAESKEAKSLGHIFDAASYLVWRYAPIRRAVVPGTLSQKNRIVSVPFQAGYK